jgi:spore coat protein H
MTRFLIRSILSLSVIPVLLPECTADNSPETGKESRVFNFIVTDPQKQQINSSRGEQYEITDPLPRLEYNGRDYTIDRFEIRGDNTLNFERKGFGVNMGDKILLYNPYNQTERKYEEFKLLAMVYDYTYIENSIATGLLRATGLWPVLSFFTEVRLNGHTQGLYHFIEDPVEYYIEKENSSCVIRRGYDHVIKSFSINPGRIQNAGYYKERFRKIYNILPDYSGSQMFDTLSSYLDLNQYFTKLSVDLLLKNGDYTDETFFYCKMKNGKQIFGVFPWDYDDLFSDEPHEIGNWWATGTVFGSREYYSMEDVVADVGSRLLFSIEDDLDYKIAKDEFLYHEYLLTLRSVMVKIDIDKIDNIFDKTLEDIGPFCENDSIIAQSKYDVHQTTQSLFLANLAQKRQMLKERRNWITGEIEKQLAEK